MASTVTFRTYRWFAARYWSSVTGSSQVVPSPFPVPSSMARWHMRIAQARQLFDDDVVAGRRYGAASKRPNFRQHLERRSESGDLGENLLGSADHLPVLDVVSGLVPRADQSPVLDRSARQVCAQMSTPPRDREVFAVDVSNGIRSRTGHRPRGQIGNRAYCDLLCHASLQSPPTVLNTSLSTYPRPHAGKRPQNGADRNSDGISPGQPWTVLRQFSCGKEAARAAMRQLN